MKVYVPLWLERGWTAFGEWANVAVWSRGRLEVRRIDVLLFFLGTFIMAYYWLFYGSRWAVAGTLMYVLVAMMALWMF